MFNFVQLLNDNNGLKRKAAPDQVLTDNNLKKIDFVKGVLEIRY